MAVVELRSQDNPEKLRFQPVRTDFADHGAGHAIDTKIFELSDRFVLSNQARLKVFQPFFAEVVRRPGLVDDLQSTFHVCLAGPTTFAALLTSLQMGFRTLAIQRKGSEVWKLLAATKFKFEKFGGLMAKVEKQVGTVQSTLKLVNSKTRTINRRLKGVEVLDEHATAAVSILADGFGEEKQIAEPVATETEL